MKKFIKILSLTLCCVMALGALSACGSKDEATDTDATTASEAKKYIIYSDNGFAPFEYLDEETNEYVGLDMDILAAIAEDQNFEYEMHNEGFDASMGAVQSGQADAMIAGMTINDERKQTFDFSDGYFEDGQIMVVPENSDVTKLEDLKGKTVAVKVSTAGAEYAESIKDQYGFTTNKYEGSPEMYQAVVSNTDAACFEDFSVIGYAIKQGTVKLKTLGDVVNPGQYGFAVKKGSNPELIEMFNKGLANIKESGKYDELLAKYGY